MDTVSITLDGPHEHLQKSEFRSELKSAIKRVAAISDIDITLSPGSIIVRFVATDATHAQLQQAVRNFDVMTHVNFNVEYENGDIVSHSFGILSVSVLPAPTSAPTLPQTTDKTPHKSHKEEIETVVIVIGGIILGVVLISIVVFTRSVKHTLYSINPRLNYF